MRGVFEEDRSPYRAYQVSTLRLSVGVMNGIRPVEVGSGYGLVCPGGGILTLPSSPGMILRRPIFAVIV